MFKRRFTERFLPNPFNDSVWGLPKDANPEVADDVIEVTNSYLTCERCFSIATTGRYNEKKQILWFTCPECNAVNEVRHIEL